MATGKINSRPRRDEIEADFNAAINRLIADSPEHPKLKALSATGKLTITFATVALEAGRSRSLIGHKGCPYQSVRERIVALTTTDMRKPSSARERHRLLRCQIEELKSQLASSLDRQLEHMLARQKAEREAKKWRDAFRRLKEEHNRIIGFPGAGS